ncbi:MAG: TonB-dependent receptor [Myxococcales bacterium]
MRPSRAKSVRSRSLLLLAGSLAMCASAVHAQDAALPPSEPATLPQAPVEPPAQVPEQVGETAPVAAPEPVLVDATAGQPAPEQPAAAAPAAPPADEAGSEAPVEPASEDAVPADGSTDEAELAELSLEQLLSLEIVSATKDKQRLEEAPAIMTVLTQDDMRKWGYRTVVDALKHVPGFYVVDDGTIPNVSTRGMGGSLHAESGGIKVLINGTAATYRSTGGQWLDSANLPVAAIERIEIIRGPASALYGADAFLGVVNIVTRQSFSSTDVGELTVGGRHRFATDNNGGDGSFAVGRNEERYRFMFSGNYDRDDRSGLKLPSSSPAPNTGERDAHSLRSQQHQDSASFYGRGEYNASDTVKLSLAGYYAQLRRDDEFSYLTQFANITDENGRPSRNQIARQNAFVTARADWAATDKVNLSLDSTFFEGQPLKGDRTENGDEFYYYQKRHRSRGNQTRLEGQWKLERVSLTVGAESIYDMELLPQVTVRSKVPAGTIEPGETVASHTQGEKAFVNLAAFSQAQWKVWDQYLTLTGGARYDHHNIYGGQPSGRIGAVSSPVERLSIKALYGTAFRAPTPELLYAIPAAPGDISGNRGLAPQRVHTIEGEVSYRFTPNLMATTGLAYNILQHGAEFVQVGAFKEALNLTSLNSLSWESSVRLRYPDNIEAYASYELNHTERDVGGSSYQSSLIGKDGVIYPRMQLHTGVNKAFPSLYFRVFGEFTLIGKRRASVDNILEKGASYYLSQYYLFDCGVSTMKLQALEGRDTDISLFVRNAFGANSPDPGFGGVDYPRLPLTVFLQLRQKI